MFLIKITIVKFIKLIISLEIKNGVYLGGWILIHVL